MKKQSKILYLLLGGLSFTLILGLYLSSQTRFTNFCDKLFEEEMAANSLTMHYTILNPENYDIQVDQMTLGNYSLDTGTQKQWLLGKLFTLKTISKNRLDEKSLQTYELLKYSLRTELEGLKYALLDEPLTPVVGIQAQLPILLAEYTFSNEADVINYLTLLSCVPDYFDSLMEFETEKINAGLFLDCNTAQQLISYCKEFLSSQQTHFLEETFKERLTALNLSSAKTDSYIKQHLQILESDVFPSYEKLKNFLTEHQNAGENADGLFYCENGTDYYAWLLRSEVGCERSFEEIEDLLEDALKKDARIIASLTKNNPTLMNQRREISMVTTNPSALTSYLAKRSWQDFPQISNVTFEICSVPKSMEDHLSPAFYLIPPIDNPEKNTIYLNHGSLGNDLSLFTTLAHESYPGHLYQTVYESLSKPHPIQRLLYFGGYTEGWGTYAEQMSYFYAPISEELAALLSSTRSMTLNLYSHLDLYIHAYGWTEEDCAAYLKKFGITQGASVHEMFLLIKQQPANYLKYYLGYLEICQLKEQARNCLGSNFDLKDFHEFILTYGPAPFSILETYLQDWIIKQQGFSDSENP